jgi:hypothetical protein
MERYKNLSGTSGVRAFKIGHENIEVRFDQDMVYTWRPDRIGPQAFEIMKHLARQGYGLNSYINTHVRKLYSSKRRWNRDLDL